jgi:hypothetical protein
LPHWRRGERLRWFFSAVRCSGKPPVLTDEANEVLVDEFLHGSPLERAYAEALRGLEHYADEMNWINHREYRGFPGYHARAVALVAIERAKAERNGETSGANLDTVTTDGI